MAPLGILALSMAMAQENPPNPETAPKPVLRNSGKPIPIECDCNATDVRAVGLSCTAEDPCPLFLELDGISTAGNRIFLAGNIHSSTTTLYSILLASDDNGATWQEPYERVRSAGLDRIQFADFANGWISGEMQQPLPRDPFLLVTADGGKTWRERPLFGEPQFGSILTFEFNSRANGSLVLDRGATGESGRYELYETSDAGETWTLRQTNAHPIPMKHTATANADWRVRADAASKSYCVEHRIGSTWRNVASFAVSMGVCKPAEEPPPVIDGSAR
jgi:photosystem II stability/assembly factor-like uncharacterized protein